MSATEVAPTQAGFVEDEDVMDDLDQGGSPAETNVQVDTSPESGTATKPEEGTESGVTAGEEPKVEDGAGKVPDAWLEEKRELEGKLSEAQQLFADISAVAKTNPAVAEALGLGGGNGNAAGGWRKQSDEAIEGLTPDSAKIMRDVLAPYAARIEQLERELGSVKPTVGRLAQNTAESNFRQGLVEAKVPVDNPAFQKILAGLMKDPDFQSARSRGAALAVRAAKAEWFAQQGRAAASGDARVSLQAAKSGKTGSRNGSAALAEKIVKFTDGFDLHRHYQTLTEAQKAGRPAPKIVYEK